MKVMVVDEDEAICKQLQAELQKEDYDVEYTTQPAGVVEKLSEAKKKGRDYAFELLLLDLRMPETDGFTLLNEIRALDPDLDVIIISAYGDEANAIEAIRLGAIDYLKKPISLQELRTAIFRVQQKRAKETPFEHRILVVDDEKKLCAYIKRELEMEGYKVAVAYDGPGGLQYFKNNRVDIVITDIRMPGMTGLQMLLECRKISDDFVSIIITGFDDHEKAIEALRLGVFEYLRKPLSIEEVITSIGKGIDLLSLRRGLYAYRRELEIEIALKTQYAEKIEKSLKEKEVMLKEIHHRVKNNLQVISSLLSLQSRHIKDKEALELFNDSRSRIYSMSLIHERLYQSKDLARIDFAGYVRTLTRSLFRSYRVNPNDIKLNIEIKDVFLNVNAGIPCGLIINELVTNSLKHGFPDGRRGEIQIGLYERKKGEFTLNVRDNGIGLPEDLDFRNTESLGMHIVLSLVEQLEGTIELDSGEGTSFTIGFRALK
jgi:two-component sensor histidine kinase/CheY-like chemotaxis protein